jgi:hypothetical protein
MLKPVWLVACCFACTFANAQESKDIITKEITFEQASPDNLLVVEGAVGGIAVEGYNGETVLIKAERIIRADTKENLEKGRGEISFEAFRKGRNEVFLDVFKVTPSPNTIYVYLMSPGSLGHEQTGTFTYADWSGSKYDYTLNYRIKVPFGTSLALRTIAGGNISVHHVAGTITASLMAGSILLDEVSGQTEARTLKGNITVRYKQNPPEECSYSTNDGNITVTYQAGLNADVICDAGGQLHIGFAASEVSRSPQSARNTAKDKAVTSNQSGTHSFSIGAGGKKMTVWAENGDVFIEKADR